MCSLDAIMASFDNTTTNNINNNNAQASKNPETAEYKKASNNKSDKVSNANNIISINQTQTSVSAVIANPILPIVASNIKNVNTEIKSNSKFNNFSLLKNSNYVKNNNNGGYSGNSNKINNNISIVKEVEKTNDNMSLISTNQGSDKAKFSFLDRISVNNSINSNKLSNMNNIINNNNNDESLFTKGSLNNETNSSFVNSENSVTFNEQMGGKELNLDKKQVSRVSDSIFLKMNLYSQSDSKSNLNNSSIKPKEYKNTISNKNNGNSQHDDIHNISINNEKQSNTDVNSSKINLNTKIIPTNSKLNKLNNISTVTSNSTNCTNNNLANNINSNNSQENKSRINRESDASINSDLGSTVFTVLDAQTVNVVDSNSISNSNNFDWFCEAFLISGAALHNPQSVLESEKFPAFCGHEMCSSFEAYKPQIIYRFPLKDTKQLELNSLVTIFKFICSYKNNKKDVLTNFISIFLFIIFLILKT